MHRRPRLLFLLALTTVLITGLTTGLTACAAPQGDPPATPEKAHLRIGALPIVDDAHLQQARAAGYFAAEGLQVDLVTLQGGSAALPLLASGDLDLAFTNYVSVVTAQAQRAGDYRFVDGGYVAGPNTLLIMTRPDSTVRSARDLGGKKIAVNTLGNILELTARSALETAGVDPKSVTFVPIPFPDMVSALRDGRADAAFAVEPFLTQAALSSGAISVIDAGSGANAGIPIGGVVVPAAFAARNPRTVAAVRRALARAQADLADRSVVEKLLPTYTKITPDTAALIALGSWPATLDRVRLQRDVDLMRRYGGLTGDLDAARLILPAG